MNPNENTKVVGGKVIKIKVSWNKLCSFHEYLTGNLLVSLLIYSIILNPTHVGFCLDLYFSFGRGYLHFLSVGTVQNHSRADAVQYEGGPVGDHLMLIHVHLNSKLLTVSSWYLYEILRIAWAVLSPQHTEIVCGDNSDISINTHLMVVIGTFVTRQHMSCGIMLGQICLYILFLLISVIKSVLLEILHTHVYNITH
jgi:hypothetical protein